jgi:hypothetical protein
MIDFFETDKKFVKPLLIMDDDAKGLLLEIMKAYPKIYTMSSYDIVFANLKRLGLIDYKSQGVGMSDNWHTATLTKKGIEMRQWLDLD